MKLKELVLCDMDETYASAFASYLMENIEGISIHVYTTQESFYAESRNFDIGIISEDFLEIEEFKTEGRITSKYILSEERPNDIQTENKYIYKYQSVENIISFIDELRITNSRAEYGKESSDGQIIGIYSPMSHELQLPFSLALCESIRSQGKVLFVDLEEISIFKDLAGVKEQKTLMDMLYEINAETDMDISSYIYQFMGIDYIPSFLNPDEISETDATSFVGLIKKLKSMGYENVVVLFGRMIPGFRNIVSELNEMIILSKPGDYYNKGNRLFINYLEKLNIETKLRQVTLNMSAGNLTDGTYCLEELLQGNLGNFVRNLKLDETITEESLAYVGA